MTQHPSFKQHAHANTGQSMVEYGIVIALVGIAALAGLTVLGNSVVDTVAVVENGNGTAGGLTGGNALSAPPNTTATTYPEGYASAIDSALPSYINASSPKSAQMTYHEDDTICGSETGATAEERCKRLQGEAIATDNGDGTITYEYPSGRTVTSGTRTDADGNTTRYYHELDPVTGIEITQEYAADGSGYSTIRTPDGSIIERQTTIDPDTGIKMIVTTITDPAGNVTTTMS